MAFACVAPMLFLLAHHAHNPDSAEMMSTALYGGVMHPSGMPLQAWINPLFVRLSAEFPVWGLSFFSWLAHFASGFVLLRILRRLNFVFVARAFALVLYSYYHSLWYLALQAEKYTLLCLTILILFIGPC